MTPYVRSISIGKKDVILYKWMRVVKRDNAEGRIMSFLIKQALMYFIRDEQFINIGKIHYEPTVDIVQKCPPINLWLEDCPEIVEWIKVLEQRKIKPVKAIKTILIHCIDIVPPDEKEYIPNYSDFISSLNNIKLTELKVDNIKYEVPESKNIAEKRMVETPVSINKQDTNYEDKQVKNVSTSIAKNDIIKHLGLGNKK